MCNSSNTISRQECVIQTCTTDQSSYKSHTAIWWKDTYQIQRTPASPDSLVKGQHHFLPEQTVTHLQSAVVTPLSQTHHLPQASPAMLECQGSCLMKYLLPKDSMDHPAMMPAALYGCLPEKKHPLHLLNDSEFITILHNSSHCALYWQIHRTV